MRESCSGNINGASLTKQLGVPREKEDPWASAFIGGQGGVHKQKAQEDFLGVFEGH